MKIFIIIASLFLAVGCGASNDVKYNPITVSIKNISDYDVIAVYPDKKFDILLNEYLGESEIDIKSGKSVSFTAYDDFFQDSVDVEIKSAGKSKTFRVFKAVPFSITNSNVPRGIAFNN